MTVGQMLKYARKQSGITLRDIEDITGVSNPYLSQLENDKIKKPSAITLYTLSKLLKIDFDKMMVAAGYVGEKETFATIQITVKPEEEQEMNEFLSFLRYRNGLRN